MNFPQLREIHKAYKNNGFEILGIAADTPESFAKYFKKNDPLPWKEIIAPELGSIYEVRGYPTYVLVDKEGKQIGIPTTPAEVNKMVAKALGVDVIELK